MRQVFCHIQCYISRETFLFSHDVIIFVTKVAIHIGNTARNVIRVFFFTFTFTYDTQ